MRLHKTHYEISYNTLKELLEFLNRFIDSEDGNTDEEAQKVYTALEGEIDDQE